MKSAALFSVRWNKCKKFDYYCASREYLSQVELPVSSHTGSGVCPYTEHSRAINKLYYDIVESLHEAERLTVPRIPLKSLKPFWPAELDELKDKAIVWHTIWVANGRPSGMAYSTN